MPLSQPFFTITVICAPCAALGSQEKAHLKSRNTVLEKVFHLTLKAMLCRQEREHVSIAFLKA